MQTIPEIITDVQTALGVDVDGRAGLETWGAIRAKIVPTPPASHSAAAEAPDAVDDRSEGVIATLQPPVRPYARALIHQCASHGITIKAIDGTRTYEQQDALFKQGGVTRARAGHSNHNFGLAFDIGVFRGDTYLPESPIYKAVGAIGQSIGLEWGGSWHSIIDEPHFELRPTWARDLSEEDMLAGLRARKATGKDLFA